MTKRLSTTKKRLTVIVVAAAIILVGGGAAFAYWTTAGSGTGTATTGQPLNVVVNQTSTVSDLAPGLSAQTLSGDFDNPNPGPVYVTAVTVTIASVTNVGSTALWL